MGPISLKSTLPALKKIKVPVKFPIEAASLFVAMAVEGGSPTNNSAGNVIKPPPPTVALMNAPTNPKKTNNRTFIKSSSVL